MQVNDVLRRLCYALTVKDSEVLAMLAAAGLATDAATLSAYFKKEEEPGYIACPKTVLEAVLDGLILKYRGPKPESPSGAETGQAAPARKPPLDNNMILRKLRIALELTDTDIIAIMKLAGVDLSASELSAFFRKRDHRNYKPCLDQFLRNFLVGLASWRKNQGKNT